MQLLMKALEEKISRLLPDKFGQVFDAWANGGAHYIATFDRLPVNKPILLAFSPVDNKRDLTNMSLYDFLFNFYGKSLENLLFIASDNCSTNQVIGKHITLPFIGRASHWFNLAVQQYLEEHKELLGKIHELMKKFSGCAHLHTYTLGAKTMPRYKMEQHLHYGSTLRAIYSTTVFGKFQTVDITRLGILPLMLSPADNAR